MVTSTAVEKMIFVVLLVKASERIIRVRKRRRTCRRIAPPLMPSARDVAANVASPDSAAARRERQIARRREHFTDGEAGDSSEANFSQAGEFYSL